MHIAGASIFFTVVTAGRRPIFRQAAACDMLRRALKKVKRRHPFKVEAIVILPDHLHCIWRLPEGDANYPMRWALIKAEVTRSLRASGVTGPVWQNRYWEHHLRNEADYAAHADYIHYNPVKHGLVENVADWPWSSFHRWLNQGIYPPDWGETAPALSADVGHE